MDNLHVYEIVGTVLFRRPGNDVRHIMECTVIRTQVGSVTQVDDAIIVGISVIATGLEMLKFNRWFEDWAYYTQDDLTDDSMKFHEDRYQAVQGKFIEVAVETKHFNAMIATGKWIDNHYVGTAIGHPLSERELTIQMRRPYSSPVVAVKIDGIWTEPIGFER